MTRQLLILPYLLMLIACKQQIHPVSSDASPVNEKSDLSDFSPGFSIEGARIYEKAGKMEEVEELLEYSFYYNLIDSAKYLVFRSAIQTGNLKSNFDIVRNFKNAQIIHADSLNETFPYFYKSLILKASKGAGIQPDSISVSEVAKDVSGDVEETHAFVQLHYKSKVFSRKVVLDSSISTIDESFYNIVNQALEVERDSARLYRVKKIMVFETDSSIFYSTDANEFVLIKLDPHHAFAFHQYPNVINLSYQEHRFPLSGEEIERLLRNLDSSGFFSKFSSKEKDLLSENLKGRIIFDLRDVFYYAQPLRVCLNPLIENYDQPYQSMIIKLADQSAGSFNPENIIDSSAPNSYSTVTFTLNGKPYSTDVFTSMNTLDIPPIIDLVNHALNEQQIDGNFYILKNPDRERCYIFMTTDQVNTANKLLAH